MDKREIEILPIYYDYILTTNYPVNIMVGGRNSGKSFFMEQLAAINMHNKKDYKLLVIEDVETNIGEGVKNGIEERIGDLGYESLYKSTKQPACISHTNGNNTIFKGYHSEKQQKQVKSLNEVTAAWYEEAENITYDQFKALRMQLRGGDPKDRQLFLTMNPINPDSFINEYFFQQEPDEVIEWFADGRPKVFIKNINVDMDMGGQIVQVIIPCMVVVSVHWDNRHLTNEQRADIEELKYSNLDQYEMLAEGKFIRPGNTFFGEFRKDVHVIEPFVIPDGWYRYTTTDYGLDMEATLWIALDYNGNGYVYKESYKPNLIISEACKEIRRVNNGDNIYNRYGPPDLHARNKTSGKTTWELFAENGWPLSETNNRRDVGAYAMKEWLRVNEVKEPDGGVVKTSRLKFFSNCTEIIRTLPQLLTDYKDPNKYATEPHELTHAPDALRYFCVMHECVPLIPRGDTIIESFFGKKEKEINGYDDSFVNGEGW